MCVCVCVCVHPEVTEEQKTLKTAKLSSFGVWVAFHVLFSITISLLQLKNCILFCLVLI